MTDRDRLIELLKNCIEENIGVDDPNARFEADYENIADYLLANGVIVPPCKVGDLLFCILNDKSIDKIYSHIEACRVTNINSFGSGSFVFGVREINKHFSHNVVLNKDAFKTFEEAEEKLKELQKNG